MKLCHVVPSLEEQHGGPSKSVRALCRALARDENHVDLFTTGPHAAATSETEGRLRVTAFRRDWPQRLCPSAGLQHALHDVTADVVHHHALWLRTLHYAHRSARAKGARFVISPRGMMSTWAWRHRRVRKAISGALIHPGALEAADGWHATSAEEEAEIRTRGFNQPVCLAPNGIEPPDALFEAAAAKHWRTACPETASRRIALFYSRLHPKKRVIELIDLWLAHGPPDWLLLLVGIPEDYTAETLESYVREKSGVGRVVVFSGLGAPPPYAVASLFLLPSHNENFGLVIAEAMANGVPVVVTDTTPWRDVMRHDLGWCVPWADYSAALRAATSRSVAELRDRGARAQTWVLREFSWERSARQLGEFYGSLKSTVS